MMPPARASSRFFRAALRMSRNLSQDRSSASSSRVSGRSSSSAACTLGHSERPGGSSRHPSSAVKGMIGAMSFRNPAAIHPRSIRVARGPSPVGSSQ
ncbi:MAG: hypothetical protein BWX47_01691 [candidate division Hyd24-12 bacterium ADurb.Bin004]|nr:MAG: hypothetical protein BWX47_01691 [candidate division Hyd24-12 bacterium ADurb.Bin004]